MQDDTRVYLWVKDFGNNADIVTKIIGIEPTYIHIQGQQNPQFPRLTNRIHSWQLQSPLSRLSHIDEHFDSLMQLLESRMAAVKNISTMFNAGINCTVNYKDWTPGIHLSKYVIRFAAEMNLSIDFDLYFRAESEEAE